jgi:multidrug efflux pump subunit AcrA (membrane-fusion protein)
MKRLIAALLIIAAAVALYLFRGALPGLAANDVSVPTAPIRKGDLTITMKLSGDIKAMKSVTLYAPFSVTDVKLLEVTKSGTMVKAGDTVAVIDATQEKDKVKEQESNVKQADKETEKVKATQHQVDEQARLDVAQARYDVEGAKLDTKKGEIVSEIDAGKARLTLETDERHLQELLNDDTARETSKASDLNTVARKRKKAEADMSLATANINLLTIKAPIDGMVVILPNWRSQMGFGQPAPFKAGDASWPGASLAEIPDLKNLVLELTVEETDRGKLNVGEMAHVKVDAVPDRSFSGKIKDISTTAQMVFDGWPPKKLFKALVDLAPDDNRLRPNMSAHADVETEKLTGVTLIPSRAVFEHNGRIVAWVKQGKNFEMRKIETGKKGDGQTEVLSGLQPGDVVALEEPKSETDAKSSKGGA